MVLTWGLTFVLIAAFSVVIFRMIQPLIQLKKVGNRLIEISGRVAGHEGEETIAAHGEKVLTAYPVYSCEVAGKTIQHTGYIRLLAEQREKGSAATILYDPESGAIWCKEDIPLMKQAAKKRIVFIVILVAVVTAVGFLP